jgi:hypothetical protein
VLRLQPGGKLQVKRLAATEQQQQDEDDGSWVKPEWGQYKQRGSVAGMPIMVSATLVIFSLPLICAGVGKFVWHCR